MIQGIEPELLISQVFNTASFAFEDPATLNEFLKIIHDFKQNPRTLKDVSLFDYYALCVSAHWCTAGTFIPTDVDNHIRHKLWLHPCDDGLFSKLVHFVLDAYSWDVTPVSLKWVRSPMTNGLLSGHHGEWFSIAAAAYSAALKRKSDLAELVREKIIAEMKRSTAVYAEFEKARDGIGRIKASYVLAHNFGDLNRVLEMWEVPESDTLKTFAKNFQETDDEFKKLSKLNLDVAAADNHRFFALRKPKCIRSRKELLLPIGPFLDEWGAVVAKTLPIVEVCEVVECLLDGWVQLKGSVAYSRALVGIETNIKGGMTALDFHLPAKVAKEWKSGKIRTMCSISKKRFEEQWNQKGLQ